MARGMNWGILSLLVVIGLVLGGIAGFFIHLARKAAAVEAGAAPPGQPAFDFGPGPAGLRDSQTWDSPEAAAPEKERRAEALSCISG